jgi:hypothetical protein
MRGLALGLLWLLSSCGGPDCIVIPGDDVEPGTYQLDVFRVHPDSIPLQGLPYADASDFVIELSDDRSTAVLRYVRNGVSVEESWDVTILD